MQRQQGWVLGMAPVKVSTKAAFLLSMSTIDCWTYLVCFLCQILWFLRFLNLTASLALIACWWKKIALVIKFTISVYIFPWLFLFDFRLLFYRALFRVDWSLKEANLVIRAVYVLVVQEFEVVFWAGVRAWNYLSVVVEDFYGATVTWTWFSHIVTKLKLVRSQVLNLVHRYLWELKLLPYFGDLWGWHVLWYLAYIWPLPYLLFIISILWTPKAVNIVFNGIITIEIALYDFFIIII